MFSCMRSGGHVDVVGLAAIDEISADRSTDDDQHEYRDKYVLENPVHFPCFIPA